MLQSPPDRILDSPVLSVAVLEDDEVLRERILLPGLKRFGFDAVGFDTIESLRQYLTLSSVDVVVLDVGLPDGDGFTLATSLHQSRPQYC